MTNQILAFVLLALCLAGIGVYGTLARWYQSLIGWTVMGLFVSLAVATGALASLYIFGAYPHRAEVFTGVYALLIIVVGSIVANIIRYQISRRK
ncbi:putative phage holin [Arthrobacter pityocampae]|uniref:putative phage holin n=1 Tax=Arthrobacter pityocampae TaxID=547334 RepID=UPI0037359C49